MWNLNNFDVLLERYNDLLREAEQARLVRAAWAGQSRSNAHARRLLVWLGCRLTAWGRRLEACSDGQASVNDAVSVNGECQ